MILTHFSVKNWKFDPKRFYLWSGHFKPVGLWLSDESDFGWKEWCEAENFHLERLESATDFIIKDSANILRISSIEEALEFNDIWSNTNKDRYFNSPKWDEVSKAYDGILITPYRKDYTVWLPTWYSGWDVSSGCFWNLDAIVPVDKDMKALTI